MRRLLLILMLLIVPAQSALAALCGYCDHGDSETDPHLRVHAAVGAVSVKADSHADHGPRVDGALADQTVDMTFGMTDVVPDGECALCHLGCSTLVWPASPPAACAPPQALPAHRPPADGLPLPDRIEHVPLAAGQSC